MLKKGLGKGLGALLDSAESENNGIRFMKLNEIEPNTGQPRKHFNDEKLTQLAESIKQHGVVQPLIVKRDEDVYKIVAGERRWRAARLAGLDSVPVIVRDLSSKQVMEIALIENLQREDLNPIEEAEAYEKLMNEFGMTQEDISITVGRSRPAIANSIRLLSLNEKIRGFVINGDLSSGHARALLTIDDFTKQMKLAEEIINKGMNVRDTEKLVKKAANNKIIRAAKKIDEDIMAIEERFREILGTKVKLVSNKKSGKILIEYYSMKELERIIEMIEYVGKKSQAL